MELVIDLQEGIRAMFEQAGCGTPAVRSLLGEGGVSEANMMQYLGILEQRTNEILQVIKPPSTTQVKNRVCHLVRRGHIATCRYKYSGGGVLQQAQASSTNCKQALH